MFSIKKYIPKTRRGTIRLYSKCKMLTRLRDEVHALGEDGPKNTIRLDEMVCGKKSNDRVSHGGIDV